MVFSNLSSILNAFEKAFKLSSKSDPKSLAISCILFPVYTFYGGAYPEGFVYVRCHTDDDAGALLYSVVLCYVGICSK